MRLFLLCCCLLCCSTISAAAKQFKPRLSTVFQDDMILQRNKPVGIFGTGPAGATVTVTFREQTVSTVVPEDGAWRCELTALEASAKGAAGEPLGVVIGKTNRSIDGVRVGDVWLCLGQSNMARGLGEEDYPIRVEGDTREYPDLIRSSNSALAYHFGRYLVTRSDVPVSLMIRAVSGSALETWLSPAVYEQFLASTGADPAQESNTGGMEMYWEPSRHYSKIKKLEGLAVAGILWDQGEGNRHRFPWRYRDLLDALYGQLCAAHGGEPLPFILIHKFGMKATISDEGLSAQEHFDTYPKPRSKTRSSEQQAVGEAMIRWIKEDPSLRVAVGNHDLKDLIHYWAKDLYGWRAADAALALTQGKTLPRQGPVFQSASVEGNTMRVRFDHADGGLTGATWIVDRAISKDFAAEWAKLDAHQVGVDGIVVKRVSATDDKDRMNSDLRALVRQLDATAPIAGFAIAGSDGVLHLADAQIDGATVVVSSPKVPQPRYVAYGFSADAAGQPGGAWHSWNLYATNGLPALPFWSGSWPPVDDED